MVTHFKALLGRLEQMFVYVFLIPIHVHSKNESILFPRDATRGSWPYYEEQERY